MNYNEIKAIERAAYGKRITFHTRHHWILTWLEEQPGKNLADKVWRVIDRAYRADYAARGHAAMGRYLEALGKGSYPALDYDGMLAALCDACEFYGRAGEQEQEDRARDLLRSVVYSKAKQAA